MNSIPLSDVFKAKVTSLIQDQLKPIVIELAVQHQTLQTHLALLKHNYNVNNYQMAKLENIRDLEQSINFKVTGALGFDPWQHPSMGTNLREPVPADPLRIPRFAPIESATRAERAVASAALVADAGISAHRLGVPLTTQDFPRDPVPRNLPKEDPMHSQVPLFGLAAPRWRAMQDIPLELMPGTASYNGEVTVPQGKRGLQLYNRRKRELGIPLCRQPEPQPDPPPAEPAPRTDDDEPNRAGAQDAPADAAAGAHTRLLSPFLLPGERPATPTNVFIPYLSASAPPVLGGRGVSLPSFDPEGESPTPTRDSPAAVMFGNMESVEDIEPGPSVSPLFTPPRPSESSVSLFTPSEPSRAENMPITEPTTAAPFAYPRLQRTESVLDFESTYGTAPGPLHPLLDMSEATTRVGSRSPIPMRPEIRPPRPRATKDKGKGKAKAKQPPALQRKTRTTATAATTATTSSASTSRAAAQPMLTTSPKRSRSAAGLDDDDDAATNTNTNTSTLLPAVELRPRHKRNDSDVIDNDHEGAGPSRKRRKRATATTALNHSDQGDAHLEPVQNQEQPRRSTRVARATAAAIAAATRPAPAPASRGKATKGKKKASARS